MLRKANGKVSKEPRRPSVKAAQKAKGSGWWWKVRHPHTLWVLPPVSYAMVWPCLRGLRNAFSWGAWVMCAATGPAVPSGTSWDSSLVGGASPFPHCQLCLERAV
jgi:hypothetical protein